MAGRVISETTVVDETRRFVRAAKASGSLEYVFLTSVLMLLSRVPDSLTEPTRAVL